MPSPSFAEVLADALRTSVRPAPTAGAASVGPSFASPPPHPFLFGAAPGLARARAVLAFCTAAKGFPKRPRPARVLTSDQQQALDGLNALGAQLAPNFTGQELRHAYRSVSLQLHPDRQHDCSATERARRARQFVAATAHYRQLRALVDGH